MRIARLAVLATMTIAACTAAPAARAGIVLTIERPDPSSADILLRWEAEGAGPFLLLRRDVTDGGSVAFVLPLLRLSNVHRTGLTGGSVVLPGEAVFAPGTDLHVYQLVDQGDRSCSNLGYVALRRGLLRSASVTLALPALTPLRSLGAILDSNPAIAAAMLTEPELCRRTWLQRSSAGGRAGLDAWIPPGRGVTIFMGMVGSPGTELEFAL